MTVNRERILRRNPYTDRRSFISRLSPLSPIGDMGTATLSEGQGAASITWETASDWDSAVSEQFVAHPDDVVTMTRGFESWEDLSDGDGLPDGWKQDGSFNPQADTNYSTDGSVSMCGDQNGGVDSGNDRLGIYLDFDDNPAPDTVAWDLRETSNSSGCGIFLSNENGDEILNAGMSNPSWGFVSGNGQVCVESSPNPSYQAFRRYTIDFDWENNTFDLTWEDIEGYGGTKTFTDEPFKVESSGIGRLSWGDTYENIYCGGSPGRIGDTWTDRIWGVYNQGSITADTKSFAENTKPDLENLSYTLNGQSIALDVIGSPGTSSEEVVTQELDGTSTFSLTWSNAHSDFRIRPNLSSEDRVTSPSISSVSLTS